MFWHERFTRNHKSVWNGLACGAESQVWMEWEWLPGSHHVSDPWQWRCSWDRSASISILEHYGLSNYPQQGKHEIKSSFLTQGTYYEIVNELKPPGASAANQVLEHVGTNHAQAESICRHLEHCFPILFHNEQPHAAVQAACWHVPSRCSMCLSIHW